jgi:hypothetical protein
MCLPCSSLTKLMGYINKVSDTHLLQFYPNATTLQQLAVP